VPEALEGSGEEERCFDKLSNRRREKKKTGREMLQQAQQPENRGKSKREKSKNIIKITLPAGA
jgi:hypothetical protein